ncbi:hypothetical protein OOK47_50630 [Streptomyces sp. NBC_00268]|nr:hypothetical protein [Streptomyces sp. NBC_01764]MCX5190651.1 hypothetical protein [Streptomyces sp. NBC_00268]
MEWTCLHRPNVVDAFIDALFVAHFALGEDLGDRATVDRHATGAGIDPDALDRAFADGSALRDLHRMEAPGAEFGVRAKPSWLVAEPWSRVCCPLPGSRSWRRTGYGTNEGLPGDIPVVEGCRLLVLDEPMYQRSWNADRFFPLLPGTADRPASCPPTRRGPGSPVPRSATGPAGLPDSVNPAVTARPPGVGVRTWSALSDKECAGVLSQLLNIFLVITELRRSVITGDHRRPG